MRNCNPKCTGGLWGTWKWWGGLRSQRSPTLWRTVDCPWFSRGREVPAESRLLGRTNYTRLVLVRESPPHIVKSCLTLRCYLTLRRCHRRASPCPWGPSVSRNPMPPGSKLPSPPPAYSSAFAPERRASHTPPA